MGSQNQLSVVALSIALICQPFGVKSDGLPAPYTDRCIVEHGENLYNPAGAYRVPWFTINLDQPADQRWNQIAVRYRTQIQDLINTIRGLAEPFLPDAIDWVDWVFGDLENKLPQPYRDEIRGISRASGIPVGQIVMYNVFYEIFTVCTSIVAEDPNGNMFHARNLDFGLFLGWNSTLHDWAVSSKLRSMIVNINWVKNGRLLFKSNNFAGFVGIYNGLKPNAFTLTANERFALKGGYVGILEWLIGRDPHGKWMTWHAREVMEFATSYEDAFNRLSTEPILSPVYYILGGRSSDQGAIITRALNSTVSVMRLDTASGNKPDGWYLLQTNYDPGTPVFYLDDRRTPGNHCMRVLGRNRVGFPGIFNVLSSKTNLNKLTTYTVLMQVNTGRFETHIQSCPNPCYAW